ncbi:hypothetical protein [Bacillus sp. SM2101]|uniref:hypothetical protein n=1 Tax=Bacillus sp. SM2101 TaxID=2805366 RepID=UPI001BDF6D65|nr:hypothetical protein [Bacillus sp. SM2101]
MNIPFEAIEITIKIITYGIAIISAYFFISWLGFDPNKVKTRFRLSKDVKNKFQSSNLLKYKWLKKYHHILDTTIKAYEQHHLSMIVWLHVSVFVLLLSVNLIVIEDFFFTLFSSFFFAFLLPIGGFWVRFKQIQSFAQESISEDIELLLQEYQKNHCNMLYALKEVSNKAEGTTQILFSKLFARMHGTTEEKQLATETFGYQIGRHWGKNLSTMILRASVQDGINIQASLQDMVDDMSEIRKKARDELSDGREAAVMGFIPIPATFLLIVLNVEFMLPGENGYSYHFATSLGLKVFIFSMIIGMINFVMALILRKPKQGL